MSWRATIACTRAQGEAIGLEDDLFPLSESAPVLVADEPDESKPDAWLIHAYFDHQPSPHELDVLAGLGSGNPRVEQLGEDDWVTMSQRGLEPIRAGRFYVHTPTHPPLDGAVNFEIDAGLAFGTGQHATTAGCLAALDRLERAGKKFTNLIDVGTGTGLLAFAAMRLWPDATAIATDIDPISIDVTRDNARINKVTLGHGPGELLLAVADGMDDAMLAARAPYDLLIANILAAPLILLAPAFTASVAKGATIVLAGLLNTQTEAVIASYEAYGCTLVDGGSGEWRILVFTAGGSGLAS